MSVRRLIRPMTIMVALVLLVTGCAPGPAATAATMDPAGRWPCG